MAVRHVEQLAELRHILSSEVQKLVVIDFHATWCGPCIGIAPKYEALARLYANRAVFLKVDVDAGAEIANTFSVSALPTFHGYRRGVKVFSFSGASEDELYREVERYAPATSEVAFAGSGQTLGTESAATAVDLDAAQPPIAVPSNESRRVAAAAAAARRMQEASAAFAANAAPVTNSVAAPENSAAPGAGPVGTSAGKAPAISGTSAKVAAALLASQDPDDEDGDVNSASAGGSSSAGPTADPALLASLLEMGFPEVRAIKGLVKTGNKSAEVAMDWCFEHSEDPDIDEPLAGVKIGEPSSAGPSMAPVEGTSERAESKSALNAEERKRIADELVLKARAKRLAEERAAEIEREKNRVRTGKEVLQAKLTHEEQQRKIMVAKRLKEKAEVIAERQRIRDKIAADKEARRAKFNMGDAGNVEHSEVQAKAPESAQPAPPPVPSGGKIQFRLPDGSRLESSFEASDTLAHAAGFIARERPDLAAGGFKFSQQYPKREFTGADMLLLLSDAHLLPRGALNVLRL